MDSYVYMLIYMCSEPCIKKRSRNHSVRPCLGGYRGAVQRGVRGRGGGGGSAINITNNIHITNISHQ